MVVLPSFSCVSNLVLVSVVSVARTVAPQKRETDVKLSGKYRTHVQ